VEWGYRSTLSLTSALDGVVGQRHAPAALLPGMTRCPLYRRLGGPSVRSGWVRKISPPLGFDFRTVPPRSQPLYRLCYPGPIALLILVSITLKYIKTNNVSPFYHCRTPYWITEIIPGLVAIASEHCNWTAPHSGCIYILNTNVINH